MLKATFTVKAGDKTYPVSISHVFINQLIPLCSIFQNAKCHLDHFDYIHVNTVITGTNKKKKEKDKRYLTTCRSRLCGILD